MYYGPLTTDIKEQRSTDTIPETRRSDRIGSLHLPRTNGRADYIDCSSKLSYSEYFPCNSRKLMLKLS